MIAGMLRQNTACTITIGQFMNWSDGKTPLYQALGGNTNFDPTKLTCYLTKGSTQSELTLSKTTGDNQMNLLADSQASFTLSAGNTDTCGRLVLSFINKTVGSEVILEGKTFEFFVVDEEYYDTLIGTDQLTVNLSTQAALDVNAEVVDAVFSKTGFTAGGTMTVSGLLKIVAAVLAGDFKDKAGESGTIQITDADNKNTAVLEIVPDVVSPYKTASVL